MFFFCVVFFLSLWHNVRTSLSLFFFCCFWVCVRACFLDTWTRPHTHLNIQFVNSAFQVSQKLLVGLVTIVLFNFIACTSLWIYNVHSKVTNFFFVWRFCQPFPLLFFLGYFFLHQKIHGKNKNVKIQMHDRYKLAVQYL